MEFKFKNWTLTIVLDYDRTEHNKKLVKNYVDRNVVHFGYPTKINRIKTLRNAPKQIIDACHALNFVAQVDFAYIYDGEVGLGHGKRIVEYLYPMD